MPAIYRDGNDHVLVQGELPDPREWVPRAPDGEITVRIPVRLLLTTAEMIQEPPIIPPKDIVDR